MNPERFARRKRGHDGTGARRMVRLGRVEAGKRTHRVGGGGAPREIGLVALWGRWVFGREGRWRIIAQKKSGRRTLRSSARWAALNHGSPYGDFTPRRFYPE